MSRRDGQLTQHHESFFIVVCRKLPCARRTFLHLKESIKRRVPSDTRVRLIENTVRTTRSQTTETGEIYHTFWQGWSTHLGVAGPDLPVGGVVGLAPPVGVVDLAPPVGVVDLHYPCWGWSGPASWFDRSGPTRTSLLRGSEPYSWCAELYEIPTNERQHLVSTTLWSQRLSYVTSLW